MSVKTDTIAILTSKRDEQVASVASMFNSMIDQVQALADTDEVGQLQAQIDQLNGQLNDMQTAATELAAKEDAEDLDQNGQIAALTAFKEKILAVVNG